jgi:oxygen-independent coproporphyrinogen-3 oxidase
MTYSLYFHIPFCKHRCAYCDFNTFAGMEAWMPAYVDALCEEIRSVAQSTSDRLAGESVFFGGGTPSLLPDDRFEAIFKVIRDNFSLADEAEISLEANPGTLSLASLQNLRALGFNRLSLGVQSAHAEELHLMERIHDYQDVIQAVQWSRQVGFENLNIDLIFGLPGQSMDYWKTSIELILGFHPEHLSLYALSIEDRTPFGRWTRRGLMPIPDPDLAADMYEWAEERLDKAGFEHYEISNWARPGRQCRHNLAYWRGLPYLGFGAGAHGCAAGLRISNVLRINTYLRRLSQAGSTPEPAFPFSPATVSWTRISRFVQMQETMLTGLRLTCEGVSAVDFAGRFGMQMRDVFRKEIDELTGLGLLEWEGAVLHLTKKGRLLGNQVFMRFVD